VSVVVQPIDPDAAEVRAAIPTGIYLFDRSVFGRVPPTGFHDIKESFIPRLHRAGLRIVAHEADAPCSRVLDARTYLALNHRLIREAVAQGSTGAWFLPATTRAAGAPLVHPTARIDEDAHLVGPVLVGPDAVIQRGATIVGPASIGAGTIVEATALVSRAVVWERCVVGAKAHVERSVLVTGTVVAPGDQVIETVRVPPRRRASRAGGTPAWAVGSRAEARRPAALADQPS
jgi:NDP-sugar pyrophosphorylase family protein